MDINIINKKLVIKYYKSIQSTLSKNNINYMWLDDIINNIINNITNEKQETITGNRFLSDVSFNQILKFGTQSSFFDDDFNECDSGFCGI